LQDFFTLKGDCGRLLKEKNLATLLPIFESINLTKQEKKIKHSRQHVPSMEKCLKGSVSTHYSYASQGCFWGLIVSLYYFEYFT
jgi:hypothetical protein